MRDLKVDIDVINPRVGDQFGFEVTNDGVPLVFTQSGQPDSIGWNKTYISSVDTRETIPANRIVKLNDDLTYRSESSTFSKFNNGVILDMIIRSTGFSYAVGSFTTYNLTTVNRFVGFNETNSESQMPAFNADVTTIKELSDGSFLFGGVFTSFGPFQVNRIFKRFANGLADSTFNNNTMSAGTNKGFNGSVNTIAVQTDGRILVGGTFNIFNNNTRNRIVRLNANGTIDNTFNIGTGFGGGFVNSIAIQPDGKILVGGSFTTYKGVAVGQLVRLDASGNLDTAFNTAIGNGTNFGSVNIIKIYENEIYVGGRFAAFNGITTRSIIKLSLTGAVISLFGTGFGNTTDTPTLLGTVRDITFLADDTILVGGSFNSYDGETLQNFAKINPDGSLSSDGIDFNDAVYKIVVNSGFIYVAGAFTTTTIGELIPGVSNLYNIPIGTTMSRTEEVYATYDNLVEFNTDPHGITYSIIFGTVSSYTGLIPDYSDVITVEYDTSYGAFADKIDNTKTYILSNGIITDENKFFSRITASGSIDTTFNPYFTGGIGGSQPTYFNQLDNGQIITIDTETGDTIKINYDGSFNNTFGAVFPLVNNNNNLFIIDYPFGSATYSTINRWNVSDCTLSTTFSMVKIIGINNNSVDVLNSLLQSDGRLLIQTIGTSSIVANGITHSNKSSSIYRFNNNGSLDTGFVLGTTFSTQQFTGYLILSNDKILYHEAKSGSYNRIKRFNSNGSLDTTFTFNGINTTDYQYRILYEQIDGKVIVLEYNSASSPYYTNKILRLNLDGSIDTTYNVDLNGIIFDTVGKVANYNNDDLFIYAGIAGYISGFIIMVPPVKLTRDGDYITNTINFTETTPVDEPDGIFVIQPDDKAIIYNASGFSGTSSTLIRINPNGTLDRSFDNYGTYVNQINVFNNGDILFVFDNFFIRVDSNDNLITSLATSYDDNFSRFTHILSNDSSIIIENTNMGTIDKFYDDGIDSYLVDETYGASGSVISNQIVAFGSVVAQSDDKILFSISATVSIVAKGGTFSKGPGVYRLNTDGSFDNTFNYSAGGLVPVTSTFNVGLKVLPDNKILFLADNYKLRKLNTNGTLDTSFAFDFDFGSSGITSIDVTIDNRIIIGGDFIYFGDEVHLMWLDINNGDVITWLYADQLTGYVRTKNYSNGDMLAIGNSTWPEFIATGKGNITRIGAEYGEIFYLDTPADQTYQATGVRMTYTFDEDEIVLNNLYDTPNHIEIDYINNSVTINEIIDEVVVRSPHLIISHDDNFDTANYQIRVWEGTIFDGASQSVLYNITKQKLFLGQDNVYININNLVRERLEANIGNFFSQDYFMAKPLAENMSKWVQVDETLTNVGATVSTSKYRLFATDGYLYNEEEQQVPKILMTGNKRYIYKDQLQRIYFQTNFLQEIRVSIDEDGSFDYEPGWNVDILGDNKNYVQSLTIDTSNYNPNNQWVEYRFTYSNSETAIVRFNIYDYSCKYDPFTLVYKNKWGVLESIGLTKKSSKKLSTTNVDFERSILDYNGSYDINRHTKKQFNVTGNESWTLNTDWMPEYMNQALEEVNLSEEVWLLDKNNNPYPVIIEDSSVDYKTAVNDKLIQYTIKVKLSHSTIKNIL